MIRKFQLGGQLQLLDLIFAMINLLPEEAINQLTQSGAKPEDIAKLIQVGVKQGKIKPEIGQAIMLVLKGQVASAKHGVKLSYLKSLKHQCAEDEELYYYKTGGKVGCGCKKKDGGEIEKAQKGTTVQKFKTRTKAELDKINKLSEEDYFNGTADHTKPGVKRREEPMLPRVTKLKSSNTNTKKKTSGFVKSTILKCGGAVLKFKNRKK